MRMLETALASSSSSPFLSFSNDGTTAVDSLKSSPNSNIVSATSLLSTSSSDAINILNSPIQVSSFSCPSKLAIYNEQEDFELANLYIRSAPIISNSKSNGQVAGILSLTGIGMPMGIDLNIDDEYQFYLDTPLEVILDVDADPDAISNLPYELVLYIMSYVNPVDVIQRVSLVCKYFYRCSRSNCLWRDIVYNEYVGSRNHRHKQHIYQHSCYLRSDSNCTSLNNHQHPDYIDWYCYYSEKSMLKRSANYIKWKTMQYSEEHYEKSSRYRHTATTVYGDKRGKKMIMLIGGISTIHQQDNSYYNQNLNQNQQQYSHSDISIIDPVTCNIISPAIEIDGQLGGGLEFGISRHTADFVQQSGSIFVFGGTRTDLQTGVSKKSNELNQIIVGNSFNCVKWMTVMPNKLTSTNSCVVPPARSDHSSCIIGNYIYIFGGSNQQVQPMNDMFKFNIEEGCWIRLETTGDVPSPRSGHSMLAVGNRSIYVYGGGVWDHKKCWVNRNSQLFHLDTETLVWTEIKCFRPPSISTFSSIFSVGYHLFVLFGGGYDGLITNCGYYFDTIENVWYPLKSKDTPTPKNSSATCIVDNTRIYFIGGEKKKSTSLQILEMDWIKLLKQSSIDINLY